MKKIPMRTYILFGILVVLTSVYVYFFVYKEFRVYKSYNTYRVQDPLKDISKLVQLKELKASYTEEELAYDDTSLCQILAKRSNTSENILALLAKHEDMYVRRCVAANSSCTPKILSSLVDDEDIFVRRLVVRHPATTFENIYEIAQKINPQIYWEVARSPLFDNKIWTLWKSPSKTQRVFLSALFNIARNENCPPEILHELADREEFFIHASIAQNKNTQKKTLEKLKSLDNTQITAIVEMRLKEQK
ncbi:hypothetical protein [Candidatus Uabimicrobium amorphum]|uniref:HEAT repeat domain-containing protein n=1 Tax=Uabimicrobium amorphum TaxID=2596890 RepID=A0A5S9IMZ6_UABAM|nr:hypothetical protein [Candidatus Uabimicrobium amorphum]BBM84839.1 hypothetical protein UABAM_03200 [Candidatus Uabimicrobium amorphum]